MSTVPSRLLIASTSSSAFFASRPALTASDRAVSSASSARDQSSAVRMLLLRSARSCRSFAMWASITSRAADPGGATSRGLSPCTFAKRGPGRAPASSSARTIALSLDRAA